MPRSVKDYYKTLNVPVNASPMDIKKAYRLLAMRFHPDKKTGDKYAEAFFKEVQEAYAVLSNPHTRRLYTQKRFYKIPGRRNENITSITPSQFLDECRRLEVHVQSLDFFRMDKEGLVVYINKLISPSTIRMLNEFGERNINDDIIASLLKSARPLPVQHTRNITDRLLNINPKSNEASMQIIRFVKSKKQEAFWNRFKIPVLITVTLLICFIIYIASG